MTVQKFLPFDNSSLANFTLWAKGISDALATLGWVQKNDTGQVVWTATVLTLTQVTVGANAVYSYSSYTGPAPRVGMSVIITGFLTGGNNVTATLTAVSGGASGTVTVALTTQADETHAGSGTTTAIAAVPSSTYVYEIWGPGDAGTAFYVKFEYGFSTTTLRFRFSVSTTTNGAGTLSGFVSDVFLEPSIDVGNQGATLYECDFSGGNNYFGAMMWRNSPTANLPAPFGFERTLATDGTPNNDGVTMLLSSNTQALQETLVFGVGPAGQKPGWLAAVGSVSTTSRTAGATQFNNQFPISPIFPEYGKVGNPMTLFAACAYIDITEGALLQTTLYGSTRTYMAGKQGSGMTQATMVGRGIGVNLVATLMRWD